MTAIPSVISTCQVRYQTVSHFATRCHFIFRYSVHNGDRSKSTLWCLSICYNFEWQSDFLETTEVDLITVAEQVNWLYLRNRKSWLSQSFERIFFLRCCELLLRRNATRCINGNCSSRIIASCVFFQVVPIKRHRFVSRTALLRPFQLQKREIIRNLRKFQVPSSIITEPWTVG